MGKNTFIDQSAVVGELNLLVQDLKKQLSNYQGDNAYKLLFALNRKMGEVSEMLNNANLRDEDFDTVLKRAEKILPMLKELRDEYLKIPAEEVAALENNTGVPPIERRKQTKNRNERT